ncbi:hypothetical protein [Psychrobacter sp.]|uniref:hypothetical protein n=1 Tax=Psychrobacter sp. TaxID=56811 RepID=UPI0025DBCD9D|nr:hypothetical protein [Psychrobacter sp.]
MKSNSPTLQAYSQMHELAKSLGAAMLACNAVCKPEGYENLYILIQNFQRPMITNHDTADVDYAYGLQSHVTAPPKTNFESQWTMIETESGTIAKFAEDIVNKHKGEIPLVRIYDGFASDGNTIKGKHEYLLKDCAITFPDGGGEIDSASRSQILQIQVTCRYNYFGQTGEIGAGKNDVYANTLMSALNAFGSYSPISSSGGVSIFG